MKHINTIALVGGVKLYKQFLYEIRKSEIIIGVDRGAYRLIDHGIVPHIAIGDFDSCTQEELKEIKRKVKDVRSFPAEKDKTDLELAVEHAMTFNPKKVIIYGAIGKRLDHELASVFLLKRLLDEEIEGIIKDAHNEVRLVRSHFEVQRAHRYAYLSLLPFTDSITVTLRGFKYNAQRKVITQGETLGVSNELRQKTGHVEIIEGLACVIRSRD